MAKLMEGHTCPTPVYQRNVQNFSESHPSPNQMVVAMWWRGSPKGSTMVAGMQVLEILRTRHLRDDKWEQATNRIQGLVEAYSYICYVYKIRDGSRLQAKFKDWFEA
jgi:hypothetical protein